ncbi:transglycosylase SLT domain-containing protein [Ensifer soli]|uniref:transglycosylase SLT domain-containing protein n=1 Tax=Ciceribacter sp. sgz301302 TaxID=3342379 RepID=UPI0035B6E593
MALRGFLGSKRALTVIFLGSTALVTGCSSVERMPADELSAVKTVTPAPAPSGTATADTEIAATAVTPIAKPGTELTAYALPKPDATVSAAAALATEQAMMQPAETAPQKIEASAEPATAQPAGAAPAAVAASQPVMTTAKTGRALVQPAAEATARPVIGEEVIVAAMESDFDNGKPVGLETIVAERLIVPVPKPRTQAIVASLTAPITSAVDALRPAPKSARPDLDRLIEQYAKLNGLPLDLVHRVVKRESGYNPRAYNSGNYGLMQIRYNTARGLGYTGPAEGLFDAETNLKYATKYLRGAWVVAENRNDHAVKLYASGYYYHAKRKGLLDELDMR